MFRIFGISIFCFFIKDFLNSNIFRNILINQKVFLSILSKHDEHNKCPFLIQNVFVDLSISLRQIRHLNIGDICFLIKKNLFIIYSDSLKSN